eukprot:5735332-Prymnesium_polylepis.1
MGYPGAVQQHGQLGWFRVAAVGTGFERANGARDDGSECVALAPIVRFCARLERSSTRVRHTHSLKT